MEQVTLQIGGGVLIGYVTGWGLKKILRIILKILVIVLAAFFAGLLWLEVQRIVTVNWKELESQINNSLTWIANEAISTQSSDHTLDQIIDALGISFAAPLGLAFVAGFMRG